MIPTSSLLSTGQTEMPAQDDMGAASLHPRHAELDALIRAGVVTHLVVVQEALDPLFAVAQMRDLPEVQFVAAFEDGLIALGCSKGLPKELKDLAQPARPTAPDQIQPGLDHGLARMEKTVQQLEFMLDALRDAEKSDAGRLAQEMTDRLAALETLIQTEKPDAEDDTLRSLKEQITGLHRRFDSVDEVKTAVGSLSDTLALVPSQDGNQALDTAQALARIEDSIKTLAAPDGTLSTMIEGLQNQAEDDGILARVSDQLDQLRQSLQDGALLEPLKAEMARLASTVQEIVTRPDPLAQPLAALQETVTRLADAPAPTLDLAPQQQAFDQFATVLSMSLRRVEGVASQIKEGLERPSVDAIPQDLLKRLDAMAEKMDSAQQPAPMIDALAERLARMDERLGTLPDEIARLGKDLSALRNQPAPVLDLTEQRRSFAGFTSTLSTVVQRLERAIESLDTQQDDTKSDAQADVLRLLSALSEQVEKGLAQLPDRTRLDASFAQLGPLVRDLPPRLSAIEAALKPVAETPELRSELAAQKEQIEQIAQALRDSLAPLARAEDLQRVIAAGSSFEPRLTEISDRLNRLPDQADQKAQFDLFVDRLLAGLAELPKAGDLAPLLADVSDLKSGTEGILSRLTNLPDPAALETALKAGREALATRLDEVAATQQPALGALRAAVETLINRPDPVPDMTAQRRAFARFTTVIATAVERLERVAEAIAAENPDRAGEALQLTAAVTALPAVVETAILRATDLSPVESALAVLQDHLRALPDQIGLATLSDRVDSLARRPDPMLDLTAQRQSFARFGTALAGVLDRMDRIAGDLAAADAGRPDITKLTGGLTRIEDLIDRQIHHQNTEIEKLAKGLESLGRDMRGVRQDTARLAESASTIEAGPAAPLSLDELRMQFAELIALQIRENAASFNP